MWQRPFHKFQLPGPTPTNGDGGSAFDHQDVAVTLQHPWMSGAPLYVPDSWVAGYEYPLICYLHDDNRSEHDLWKWFPAISDQNFLGLGIRAPFPARSHMPGQYCWRGHRPDATAAVLSESIEEALLDWNIHPDRIILMGEGNGAVAALQQFMLNQFQADQDSVRYCGVVCRNLPNWWARALPPVAEYTTGRMLLMEPQFNDNDDETPAAIDGLSESGISVTVTGKSVESPAQIINQWVMSSISSVVY